MPAKAAAAPRRRSRREASTDGGVKPAEARAKTSVAPGITGPSRIIFSTTFHETVGTYLVLHPACQCEMLLRLAVALSVLCAADALRAVPLAQSHLSARSRAASASLCMALGGEPELARSEEPPAAPSTVELASTGSSRGETASAEAHSTPMSAPEEMPAPAAWFTDDPLPAARVDSEPPAVASEPEEPPDPRAVLNEGDLTSTRWKVLIQPRADGWVGSQPYEGEFTLLEGGAVVWGGSIGGLGVNGRWQLRDELLEVVRTTPLGVVTGRDYYMADARAETTGKLQFALRGVIRSFNALYPVAVVADFLAVKMPGRFLINDDEEG